MRFDILFVFGSATGMEPPAIAHVRRFLREALHLLKAHSRRDIEYEVAQIDVTKDNLELRCQLNVVPTWPAAARLTDTEMIRMGIPHPTRARATTALLLWIASMYIADPIQNPLIRAWCDFTGDQTANPPISIKTYDYRVSQPMTKPVKMTYGVNQHRSQPIRWHKDD